MGAAALEPGQPDGGTVPRTLKRPAADIPEILAAGVVGWSLAGDDEDLEPAEMGPHGGGPRELEALVADAMPSNSVIVAELVFQRESHLGVVNAGGTSGAAVPVD